MRSNKRQKSFLKKRLKKCLNIVFKEKKTFANEAKVLFQDVDLREKEVVTLQYFDLFLKFSRVYLSKFKAYFNKKISINHLILPNFPLKSPKNKNGISGY
jgi:hypothetical protein